MKCIVLFVLNLSLLTSRLLIIDCLSLTLFIIHGSVIKFLGTGSVEFIAKMAVACNCHEMPPTSPRASITCLDLMTTHGRRAMPSGPSYHSSNSPITDH